jgi:hypothetical protein
LIDFAPICAPPILRTRGSARMVAALDEQEQ